LCPCFSPVIDKSQIRHFLQTDIRRGIRKGTGTRLIMNKIENVSIGPMPESEYLKPMRMQFMQNGRKRYWDFVKLHESVAIVIYNKSRDVLILVKQFRPAVFYNGAMKPSGGNEIQAVEWASISPESGLTIELCAGICDNPALSNAEIAKQEVFEECGYDVPIENFQRIISYRSGIGVSGDKQTLFYTEVTDAMKVSEGGGNVNEGEMIDVVEMTIPEIEKYLTQELVASPGGFLFAVNWFLAKRASKNE